MNKPFSLAVILTLIAAVFIAGTMISDLYDEVQLLEAQVETISKNVYYKADTGIRYKIFNDMAVIIGDSATEGDTLFPAYIKRPKANKCK